MALASASRCFSISRPFHRSSIDLCPSICSDALLSPTCLVPPKAYRHHLHRLKTTRLSSFSISASLPPLSNPFLPFRLQRATEPTSTTSRTRHIMATSAVATPQYTGVVPKGGSETEAPSEEVTLVQLEDLKWDNSFVRELPGDSVVGGPVRIVRNACYSRMPLKMQVKDPQMVAFSKECAEMLGIDPSEFERPEAPIIFAGSQQMKGSEPYAQCYGGHQFGHWAGQLGDGRAITLGEILSPAGKRWELQLKGAGKTPYSRHADGMAVLRSSIREFLCSEAMHHLGVPTTRALSLVVTGQGVMRDMFYDGNAKVEPGAVVCRVAPSFLRFGSYQIHASRGGVEKDIVRVLANYTIRHHFPHLDGLPDESPAVAESEGEAIGERTADADAEEKKAPLPGNKYTALLDEVAERTARLIAMWQGVGFTHGVLNTDNMSVVGLTIDYGPFGFVEKFDTQYTPNTTDLPGRRYCFGNQPDVGLWNIVQLANSFLTADLLTADEAQQSIERYADVFYKEYEDKMRRKVGLKEYNKDIVTPLLRLMSADSVDFTNLFRALADVGGGSEASTSSSSSLLKPLEGVLPSDLSEERRQAWAEWVRIYVAQLAADGTSHEERRASMNAVNPRYICRNYLCQTAIEAAEAGDYSEVRRFLEVLKRPYEDQPGMEKYAAPPPDWASKRGVCMLSCSS